MWSSGFVVYLIGMLIYPGRFEGLIERVLYDGGQACGLGGFPALDGGGAVHVQAFGFVCVHAEIGCGTAQSAFDVDGIFDREEEVHEAGSPCSMGRR
jgi:hypothetical protein